MFTFFSAIGLIKSISCFKSLTANSTDLAFDQKNIKNSNTLRITWWLFVLSKNLNCQWLDFFRVKLIRLPKWQNKVISQKQPWLNKVLFHDFLSLKDYLKYFKRNFTIIISSNWRAQDISDSNNLSELFQKENKDIIVLPFD